jgi:prepilin-type N-terminal cleavage/methylation domain-containing protein
MRSTRRAFTLVELMVVLGVVAMLIGSLTMSVSNAQQRAKVAKAESEVKIISQAILSYENYHNTLPTMIDRPADANSLGFLMGRGASADSGGKIPTLLMAALAGDGKLTDPWNRPYKISIRQGGANVKMNGGTGNMMTGFWFPNFYRLSAGERQ